MNRSKGKASPKTSNQVKKPKSKARNPVPRGPSRQPTPVAAAYSLRVESGRPQITQISNTRIRVKHKELLFSLTGSINYAVAKTIPINPGMPSFGQWLSTQAAGWEKFEFRAVGIESVTRTGTQIPGSIQLVPDYDAADAAPGTEMLAATYAGCVEDAPWKTLMLRLNPARLKGERYIRAGGLAANQDITLRDPAQVFITTTDGTAVAWSKVWVHYEVDLINPQTNNGGVYGAGTITNGTAPSSGAPFGGNPPILTGSFTSSMGTNTNVLTLTGLAIGAEYSIAIYIAGTVISSVGIGTAVGCTINTNASGYPAAATSGFSFATIVATAATASVVYSVTATTVTSSYTVIAALTPTPSF